MTDCPRDGVICGNGDNGMGTLPASLPNLMVQAGCCVTGVVYKMISVGFGDNPVMRESCNCTNIFGDSIYILFRARKGSS